MGLMPRCSATHFVAFLPLDSRGRADGVTFVQAGDANALAAAAAVADLVGGHADKLAALADDNDVVAGAHAQGGDAPPALLGDLDVQTALAAAGLAVGFAGLGLDAVLVDG